MSDRIPDQASERRLEQLRAEAAANGVVPGAGVHPAGSPMPDAATTRGTGVLSGADGYYGQPLLKRPVWTFEVPLYFFVGGAAGASSVVALAAQMTGGDDDLVRDARWIAAIGAALSGPLLVADLGRPERFLNMLRVFKPQSAMSVGAWTLSAFGASSTAAVLFRRRLPLLGNVAATAAAVSGLGMATYTGVLLGTTVIPVWNEHAGMLPIHFAASALASSVSILELRGHDRPALNLIGIAVAAYETYSASQSGAQQSSSSKPLREGESGLIIALAGIFSGPLPLVLRLAGLRSRRARRAAAAAAIIGSLLTRFGWIEAGKASAADPAVVLDRDD